ncbi:MAG: pirin family protein, partial [Myxococcales bacterium]|nr:pirin family protein [Myxococcales bacterium]
MMMGLHPAQQRLHQTETGRTAWVTFPTKGGGFGPLEGFEEIVLEPRCDNRPLPHHEGDTLTYVHEGAVAYANSRGESGVMRAGELRRMTGVAQSQQLEANASDSDSAQLFRMKLADNRRAVEPRDEQRRFGIANQRVGLCVIASHDGRNGSLRLQQEALVFSAVLSA